MVFLALNDLLKQMAFRSQTQPTKSFRESASWPRRSTKALDLVKESPNRFGRGFNLGPMVKNRVSEGAVLTDV